MTLGQRIQELRKQASLSQEGLGEALGVSRQAVSKWEGDNGIPELDTLIAMSRLFGVTLGQLLGVESPKAAEAPASAAGFTEEQVEDILRRYAEETRQHVETGMYGKHGWKTPVIAVAGLAALVVFFGIQMGHMKSTIGNLESRLSYLNSGLSNVSSQIGNMEYRIQSILTEQAELLNTFAWSVEEFDLEKETVTIVLSASLKAYKADNTMQFIMDCILPDGTKEQVATGFVDGPDFKSSVTVSMNSHTTVSIRLTDAEGNLQEQRAEEIYALQEENFQLEACNLRTPFKMTISRFGSVSETTTSEDAYVDIVTNYPDLFWPEEAWLIAQVNGEEVLSERLTVTKSKEDTCRYYGRLRDVYHEVSLTEGDTFTVTLRVTDNLGREKEFTEDWGVENGRLEGTPLAAPASTVDW